MKVFRIKCRVEDVVTYLLDYPEGDFDLDIVDLRGLSKKTWTPPKVYKESPQLPSSEFSHLWESVGSIIVDETAYEKYATLLEMCGELLPLDFDEKKLYLYNCTQVVDAHDGPLPRVYMPSEKYRFIEHRLQGHSLFMLPNAVGLFCVDADNVIEESIHDEVRVLLGSERNGLLIQEVWDSEKT